MLNQKKKGLQCQRRDWKEAQKMSMKSCMSGRFTGELNFYIFYPFFLLLSNNVPRTGMRGKQQMQRKH